jgi:ribonuclease HII
MARQLPTLDYEHLFVQKGFNDIAGLDEAGRGAWAGPVSAAAVILPLDDPTQIARLGDVRDSKLCTPRQREALYVNICEIATSWAVSLVPACRIDEIGIVPATRQAMREAIATLDPSPEALLIDALRLPSISVPQCSVKKGDRKCLTIAAASIIAKVTRDRAMMVAEETLPGYGFERHKGYGTRYHRQALHRLGPTHMHRWYFAPVRAVAADLGLQSPRSVKRDQP